MPLPPDPDPDPSSPAAMTAPAPPPWRVHVIEALHTLRIAPLLAGVRGDPPLDVAALAQSPWPWAR